MEFIFPYSYKQFFISKHSKVYTDKNKATENTYSVYIFVDVHSWMADCQFLINNIYDSNLRIDPLYDKGWDNTTLQKVVLLSPWAWSTETRFLRWTIIVN